jgi:hypothetical protein
MHVECSWEIQEEREYLELRRRRWKDNIKMGVKEIGWVVTVELICLRRVFINREMIIRLS